MPAEEEIRQDFENFFRQHYERLCSYAYTFLKDEESCEDLVQDIFIKIWEQRQNLIGSDQLKFYVFTAVRNNCLTALKKNKKNAIHEWSDEDAPDEIEIRIDPKETSTDPQTLISKAMEQLPPKCREVFLLSRLSGQTYQQIADSLNISVKTVENQMGKAIKVLKVFARDNRIYLSVLFCMGYEKYAMDAIGVLIEKCFY